MNLSARMLSNAVSVNSFEYIPQVKSYEGDAADVYFQLIDADRLPTSQSYYPSGLRYMPAASSTLAVTIDSIDNAKKITRFATQPFPLDPSIWKFTVLAADALAGTLSLRLTLTEPVVVGQVTTSVVAHARVPSALIFGSSTCRLS